MYHPYFRGKQFELLTIRETADTLAGAGFVPIIEPVRETLTGLGRALKAIRDARGSAIVIVNPHHGDHAGNGENISNFLQDDESRDDNIVAGILLTEDINTDRAIALYEEHDDFDPVFVHAGFKDPKELAARFRGSLGDTKHVFVEKHCRILYRKPFEGATRILLRDGFERKKNADYSPDTNFSDLHVTFREEGMDGFGDFLIVGDDYTEGGGPAYAVTIHITYIDPGRDNEMRVYHFVSVSRDTPTDPAGKFKEALELLVAKLDAGTSHIYESTAIQEFRELHRKKHFPGLGYVKKLSMKHHIETLANFFA
jgi:hypothetical protein